MNRVVLSAARLAAARKPMSTAAAAAPKYGKTFKQTWLSDQGAWPVIGVLAGAVALCGTFITRKTLFHPDVRVTSSKRHATIRDWK